MCPPKIGKSLRIYEWVFNGKESRYSNVVGMTPCIAYARLQQICNAEYQIGYMNISTPPDLCTDQKYLGVRALQDYWNASYDGTLKAHCYSPLFHNFTADIQMAVCNEKIKIFDICPQLRGTMAPGTPMASAPNTAIKSMPMGTSTMGILWWSHTGFCATKIPEELKSPLWAVQHVLAECAT
ncbi:hypothetical protein B0H10DRAFT_1958466 [Mycena sp. CBHHK59/15]|nr:hypothetical protein B0H10DRAFT_1958466 [Mycena sp. CBHHK59/15]